jgi:peptide/nickel transport system permease protein
VNIELAVLALVVSVGLAVPVGILAAVRRDTAADYLARSLAILLLAIPSFWLGLLVITYGFAWFGWVPPLRYKDLWSDPSSNLKTIWVPAVILGAGLSGTLMRITRSTMLEVMGQDYIRTAWAKGLRERSVVYRHGVRNALIPVITVVGLQVPVVLGGSVIVEKIFTLPGIGSYLLDAINLRDYPSVQGVVLITACIVVVTNLVVDLVYTVVDPRIRLA